ncbi:alpha/beta hydrolase [Streptomyces sp. SID13031]|uniref:alpha/beta hydrolase n=1 Tax=Streptomyces sp. SID13031 TaxID=2706046 RepID=UPI0013C5C1C0|nr:alpha/beta hydrolase [Streptomyces sp. SID13031]NEA32260.1 alpha/beta hydrolase [Streptomyces sp. SID13031]
MTVKTVGQVGVPGATLYYESTGSGPVLLLIAGGGTDASVFDGIVPQLAARYTVVTYDPRGNSRSPYDAEPVDERVDLAAEDALAVLDTVAGGESAYVFGSSSGAITAMELLVRHPDRIRLLIAHEPPAIELLPDATEARAFFRSVYDTYQRDGRLAADQLFFGGIGLDDEDRLPPAADLPPEFRKVAERMEANSEIFYAHKLLPFTSYVPDVAALVALEDKLVPAVGSESSKVLPAEPILALADRVGWDVIAFPGGHGGYASDPFEFATLLQRVLTGDLR